MVRRQAVLIFIEAGLFGQPAAKPCCLKPADRVHRAIGRWVPFFVQMTKLAGREMFREF